MIRLLQKDERVSTKILPAYKGKSVVLAFECTELFVPYLVVALKSVIHHTSSDRKYDILVLSSEIEEHDEKELRKLANNRENVTIRVFNPQDIVAGYIKKARFQYLEINYFRLALPWILSEYEKVINLGADLIVNKDIADLYDTALADDCLMAGVPDLGYHGRLSIDISPSELNKADPYTYVNADVVIFNLKAIRQEIDQNYLMSIWQRRQFMCAEQDVFNMAFDEHIKLLDMRWNVFPDRMASEYHIEHAPAASVALWRESLKDPFIIHYAAYPKPWDYPQVGFGFKWWEYARQTPYYEEIIRRMCVIACKGAGTEAVPIGVKGAMVNYCKKHCPKWLLPVAKKIKRFLKW